MSRKSRRAVRIIAIVLAALLVGGVVFSALVSALAESPREAAGRDRYELTMTYLEDEQALHVEQRLVYINRTGDALNRVVFCAAPNMFRRESALMYENSDLEAVFPYGYAPGGIDLRSVRVNGLEADYGFQGADELYLRVACEVQPGETIIFEFDYYLLLTRCNAFIGVGATDVRLGAYYFIPGIYNPAYREFIVSKPLPFARWLYTDAADYEITLALPERYDAASVGIISREDGAWRATARNAREFALSFGKRWRQLERQASGGTVVRVLSGSRDAARVADAAIQAIEQCEAWFGDFPTEALTIAQSDYPLGALNYPGYIQLSSGLFDRANRAEMEKRIRFCIAQQYFGLSAYVEPSADAWLSDSVCEYLSCLMLEADAGHDAFLAAINRDWVSALQLTIPGGLTVTSDASLFDAGQYDIVVRRRGAVVLHELREAMGREAMIQGLRRFYALGQGGGTLTEMDFVACMDAASGRSWEDFLTDWVFNVGEYVNQTIDWLD